MQTAELRMRELPNGQFVVSQETLQSMMEGRTGHAFHVIVFMGWGFSFAGLVYGHRRNLVSGLQIQT